MFDDYTRHRLIIATHTAAALCKEIAIVNWLIVEILEFIEFIEILELIIVWKGIVARDLPRERASQGFVSQCATRHCLNKLPSNGRDGLAVNYTFFAAI